MAVDYYLKIDGIEGESADSSHKNEIDLESFSWGASQSGSMAYGGGGGAGKASFQDFHFVMKVSKASPKLFLACASGQHIKSAILVCRRAGTEQQEYMTISMSDILVSSYQAGGSGGDVVPMDQISLNYAKIEVSYSPQDAKGSLGSPVKTGWNVKENIKV
jgi:type VI secretion system secreted protein Hcp